MDQVEKVSSNPEIPKSEYIQSGWLRKFEREFIRKSGEHLIVTGITGSGKTQALYWLVDGLSLYETIVWYDIGKSGEILKLAEITGKPLKIFIPGGCEIEVPENVDHEIHETSMNMINFGREVWGNIDPDFVNILSFQPFILDPSTFTKTIAESFRSLILMAHRYEIETPISLLYDEFHNVVPSQESALDFQHYRAGSLVQFNLEKLRSLDVRIVASTHGFTKIRKGVRTSFNWILIKRISDNMGYEQRKLEKFIPMFHTLKNEEGIIVYPNKIFSDKIKLPFYGDPKKRVFYRGIFQI
jgi:hypothetical protein